METYESLTDWLKHNTDALDQIMTQYNVSLGEAILILKDLVERNQL